jgi:hypothetical protein
LRFRKTAEGIWQSLEAVMLADPRSALSIVGTLVAFLIGAAFLSAVISTVLSVYAIFYWALH